MKNLKKVLALVLACVMVFGTVAVAGSVYPDVADDAIYAESVKTLSALGIIKGDENGNFNPDNTVTRAEMAKILCTMLGTGEIAQANTIFSDVPSSHWASGYVNYAQQYGAIAGYGDGTFGPEDPVTYEQVIKLIMAALGYTTKAEENGGYPTGYLYVAADAEVTERAIGNGPEPAPRSTVAILACNAMNTPVMERTTYGTEALWTELDGNNDREFKTLLTSRHKTYKVEGKVTNSYKGKTSLKDGFVDTEITKNLNINVQNVLGANADWEVKSISAAGTDAAEYVGYESYLYYKVTATGDVELICVSPKSAKNKSIVIDDPSNIWNSTDDEDGDAPQAIGSGDNLKYVFTYWNDRDTENRITKVDLDAATDIYTNNGEVDHINPDDITDFVPAKGSVTLVDTDNDGDYDLIKVEKIYTAMVNSINAKTSRVYIKPEAKDAEYENGTSVTGFGLSKDIHANLREYSITIDGAAADVADLKEYDVLSVKTNSWDDPTYFDIEVTRNVIEGKVTAKKTGVNAYVVINGEKYQPASVYAGDAIEVEEEGKFYLNADGEIVLKQTTSVVSGDYAYLYSTGSGSFAGETYVRMFTKNGEDVMYKLADKVKVNGVQLTSTNDALTIADLDAIFGTEYKTEETADDAAVVDTLFVTGATVPVEPEAERPETEPAEDAEQAVKDAWAAWVAYDADVAAYNASFAGSNLTASALVKALVDGADADARTGYTLDTDYITLAENLAKFVTYKADSNGNITEINLAVAGAAKDEFGLISGGTAYNWKEAIAKFDGTSQTIAENGIIFFVGGATISDYGVKTVADLVNGTSYTPYFFTKTDDGAAVAVMFGSISNIDTKDSFAIFAGSSSTKYDGDDARSVSYWKDGVLIETPLTVVGTTGTGIVDGMEIGDAFLYTTETDGTVEDIAVIFSAGAAPTIADGALTLNATITIPGDMENDFDILGETGDENADSELYFGIVAATKSITDGVRLTLFNESGADNEYAQTINVPNDVKVTYLNTSVNNPDKRISEAVLTDILASSSQKVDGNFAFVAPEGSTEAQAAAFITEQLAGFNYAFVRVYKDVVTEIIFVRYASDF